MIENVLEIKDTHVREVMTPLVDVVAIDASATLVDFHSFWVTHQYSRSVRRVIASFCIENKFPSKGAKEFIYDLQGACF